MDANNLLCPSTPHGQSERGMVVQLLMEKVVNRVWLAKSIDGHIRQTTVESREFENRFRISFPRAAVKTSLQTGYL